MTDWLPMKRFLDTLQLVAHEARHLAYSRGRVFGDRIDTDWVKGLESNPERAERLEAFVSRYARMQDTIAARLLPRLLQAQAEEPGTQLEVLDRAERLGVLESVEDWLEARALRNRLVHEYMQDAAEFAADLALAERHTTGVLDTYERVRRFAAERMGVAAEDLPAPTDS